MSYQEGDVERLNGAAAEVGKAELENIAQAVISALKENASYGLYGDDVAVQNLWDEYCWWLQEDSSIGNLEEVIEAYVYAKIDQLPRHTLICLTAYSYAVSDDPYIDENLSIGTISKHDIQRACISLIIEKNLERQLNLIGPGRVYEIGFYVKKDGVVFSALYTETLNEILATHLNSLIYSEELSSVASDIADAYLEQITDEVESHDLSDLIGVLKPDIKELLITRDIMPDILSTQAALQEALG